MKDFLGVELEVGDSVVFVEPIYKSLRKGKIIKFTPKMVTIQDYDEPRLRRHEVVNRFSSDMVMYDHEI